MTDRLLVDVGADGQVSVSAWPDGDAFPSPAGEPFELVWPLDTDASEDLRWYLEDYVRAPFGVYEERGPRVAGQLTAWGQAVFAAVFGAGPARDAYVRMRSRAGAGVEIVFRSSAPGWLGLPWELLCDPDRPTPVALDRVAVSRTLPAAALAEAFSVGGERLRVLMVISRPQGAADVGYRMIARPLLERLEARPRCRWWCSTPGIASFGLDGVVVEIGLRVFGADFARLDPTQCRETVLQLLAQRRLLLIWDNFESVQSMPDPTGLRRADGLAQRPPPEHARGLALPGHHRPPGAAGRAARNRSISRA